MTPLFLSTDFGLRGGSSRLTWSRTRHCNDTSHSGNNRSNSAACCFQSIKPPDIEITSSATQRF
ncbi:MAG: hypothetical protein O3C43_11870 [Verrucomicrobia bacterium]|nr:hypothetical protein [Verrucomicrobiota bacterium]MDA1067189.1 hypothetical protein [Verrucomicrobiota bacterium]